MYARRYLEYVITLVLYLSGITNSGTSLSLKNANICRTLYSPRHRVVRLLLTAIIMIDICFIPSFFRSLIIYRSSSPTNYFIYVTSLHN